MDENYALVEFLNTINAVIHQTFHATKRIKLISFDVSNNYIIFGASSGGIYIFKKEPCQFLTLIPSKEGTACKLLISPDEKNIAIGSSIGSILILTNFFVDFNLRYEIYTEHKGRTITCMKWHNNDLYCGDNTGKISVVILTNVLSKAMFQLPTASLMQLDSSIVQIDTYSKFLLISTQTRTYLCDTDKEQYRQIGRKLREGLYGTCFFNVCDRPDECRYSNSVRGAFKSLKDKEQFSECANNDVKIYCARPGARLWEANFEASVILTHQFRNSFSKKPSDLLVISDDTDARLSISSFPDGDRVPASFNFCKIYPVFNRFILTYDSEGIYIFDPALSALVFWNNSFRNIKDVVIRNSLVYIWQNRLELKILSLLPVEKLIIKTLQQQQYYVCADLCSKFKDVVLNSIDTSKKIHLIRILKSKLSNTHLSCLLEELSPIFDKLDKYSVKKTVGLKLKNGIVIVDNAHLQIHEADIDNYSENSTKELKLDVDLNNKILHKQYKLHKTHKNVDIPDLIRLYETQESMNAIFSLFEEFIVYVNDLTGENVRKWCQVQFLKQLSQRNEDLLKLNEKCREFMVEAFIDVNKSTEMACTCCNFPLSKAHLNKPKYLISRKFIEEETADNFNLYLKNVPFLYKFKLHKIDNKDDIDLNLALIIQYSDGEVLKQILNEFTYDTWDEALKYLIKLHGGKCLNCGAEVDVAGAFSWIDFGLLMVQSIGAQNAIKLLKRYSKFVPNGALDVRFYQACIFSAATNLRKESVGFVEKHSNNDALEFGKVMERYIQKKYVQDSSSFASYLLSDALFVELKCTYCDLSLNTPIIDDSAKLGCGHAFHKFCLSRSGNICNICTG